MRLLSVILVVAAVNVIILLSKVDKNPLTLSIYLLHLYHLIIGTSIFRNNFKKSFPLRHLNHMLFFFVEVITPTNYHDDLNKDRDNEPFHKKQV